MSNEALIFSGIFMGATTIILTVIMGLILKTPKFNPIKALNIKPGVYQNVETGEIVEVKSFNGNMVYVLSECGGFNIRYDILDRNYKYVGDL